jgi:hypothetical protein
VASPERARAVLGFTARVTPEDGLLAFGSAPLRGDPARNRWTRGLPAGSIR